MCAHKLIQVVDASPPARSATIELADQSTAPPPGSVERTQAAVRLFVDLPTSWCLREVGQRLLESQSRTDARRHVPTSRLPKERQSRVVDEVATAFTATREGRRLPRSSRRAHAHHQKCPPPDWERIRSRVRYRVVTLEGLPLSFVIVASVLGSTIGGAPGVEGLGVLVPPEGGV